MPEELRDRLLFELLRDSHAYASGFDHDHPGEPDALALPPKRRLELARSRAKSTVERAARRAGFNRRHFDPDRAARQLAAVLDRSDAFEDAYRSLADERSRGLMVDLLKLRALGPSHVDLPVGAAAYRRRQAELDRRFRTEAGGLAVDDPFIDRLHLYEIERPGGSAIRLYSHSTVALNMFVLEQYAYSHDGTVVAAVEGDVAIDAGGCWGDTALYLAERVGPAGRVYTFEFDPANLAILRRNLALNPELAERVVVVEEALWERSGERLEFDPAGQLTSLTRDGSSRGATVRTVTIDDFAAREGIERVGFLKMDIEGAEPHVLSGATTVLREHAPRLAVAAYHQPSDLVELPAIVRRAQPGYRLYLDHFSASDVETVLFGATA